MASPPNGAFRARHAPQTSMFFRRWASESVRRATFATGNPDRDQKASSASYGRRFLGGRASRRCARIWPELRRYWVAIARRTDTSRGARAYPGGVQQRCDLLAHAEEDRASRPCALQALPKPARLRSSRRWKNCRSTIGLARRLTGWRDRSFRGTGDWGPFRREGIFLL